MKRITLILFFIGVLFAWNCTNNQTASNEPIPKVILVEDLQKVYCPVDLGSAESDITNNRTFLAAHDLSPNLDDYPEQPDWKYIDSIYQTAPFDTMTDSKKRVYQQAASILILRNHGLLTQFNEKEKIASYTKTYVDSGGKSAGLLFYCLVALGDSLPPTQKKSYVNAVVPRSSKVVTDIKNWMKTTQATLKDQDFPAEVKASLKTDFANLENIVKTEQLFASRLQRMIR